jgi:hypothetical protein
MTTSKKRPATKKAVTRKVSKTSTIRKKNLPAPVSAKTTSKTTVRHNKVATQALVFLDEAATLLRDGIRESAKTTEKSRIVAKKKAHHLIGRASRELSKAIEEGASSLQRLIKRI